MSVHDFLDEDLRTQAVLFVVDSMGEEEARRYRFHLTQCDVCQGEVLALSKTASDLSLLAREEQPPPELWNRVLERIQRPDAGRDAHAATQIWKGWAAARRDASERADFVFVAGDASEFEPTAVPGIEARNLFVDVESDRVTMLVRMAPGTSYPAHRHAGAEECMVLQGDLQVGEKQMRQGDFQHAEPGSVHAVQSTRGGCVLLLVSSLGDEILES
jgi:quercetin dioxygenase-like cupin family protein